MIINLQDYWRRVRAKEEELRKQFQGAVIYIANRDTGAIRFGDAADVAQPLIEETHRLATEEEIAAAKSVDAAAAQKLRERQSARVTTFVVAAPAAARAIESTRKEGK